MDLVTSPYQIDWNFGELPREPKEGTIFLVVVPNVYFGPVKATKHKDEMKWVGMSCINDVICVGKYWTSCNRIVKDAEWTMWVEMNVWYKEVYNE